MLRVIVMSQNDELSKELKEKVDKHDLSHVETQESKAEMVLKLKCAEGGELQDFPMCPDHEVQFVYEEGSTTMKCDVADCQQTVSVPECHGAPMTPFITST